LQSNSESRMLRPKKEKSKVKLTKDSYAKAGKFFHYLRPYRFSYLIGWVFLILSTSTGLLFPYLMGKLLGGTTGGFSSSSESIKLLSLDNINSVALALFILFGLQSLFSFFRVIIFTNVTENALRDLRNDAFSRLIYMPMDFFNRNKVGELTSRLSADITQVQETMKTTIAEFFRQIVIIIGSILFLLFISWKLALIMLATVPVMAIIAVFFGRFIRRLSKEAQDFSAQSNSIVEEALTGISNVKSFTNEIFILNNYKRSSKQIRDLNVRSGIWRGVFVSFIIFCLFGAIVFIIWRGLLMTQGANPELSGEGFFQFIMFTMMMGASVGSIPELYASIQKAIGATENLMNIISEKSERELFTGKLKPQINGNVSFNSVSFTYPQRSDIEVINDISFSSSANQTIALVGASGSGKSTIASLILQFYPIMKGQILFDGIAGDQIDTEYLRQHMAIVPQEVILFAGTIRDNILFGNPDANEQQILDAAQKANAWEFISSFPDGLNTQVGDRGIQLSGGQKQRIAIARAIIKNPTILILDEATSALDSESEKLVQDALDKLMEGRTSFVIAHRLSTTKNADKILVIQKGEIIESGTHDELIQLNGNYTKLVNLQTVDSNL
jgi:ABC-type multidrug transport system fused ATPase/permease subunit